MKFEWDPAKSTLDYTEQRFVAYGLIKARVHVCVFTERPPKRRLIGLRTANAREVRAYLEAHDG